MRLHSKEKTMSKEKYTIDFTNVKYYLEMHGVIWYALAFPDYYGCNWSAFWDCLTDMYGEPIHIEIIGLEVIERKFGDYASKLMEVFRDLKHYRDDKYIDEIQIVIVSGKRRLLLQ